MEVLGMNIKSGFEVKMSVVDKALEVMTCEEFFLLQKILLKIQDSNKEDFIGVKTCWESLIKANGGFQKLSSLTYCY